MTSTDKSNSYQMRANKLNKPKIPQYTTPEELLKLSVERLEDANVLFRDGRYEGAYYICGYAIEMKLKKKICDTLGWGKFPDYEKDKKLAKKLKTHNLEILLHNSGVEKDISLTAQWVNVVSWNSEIRYSAEKREEEDVKLMIEATEQLLKML